MRVLVACEFSGVVREAFRARGHDAWSADLLPADDGSQHHYQGDARDVLEPGRWDLLIAHPPYTCLANSGVRWLYARPGDGRDALRAQQRWRDMADAAALFRDFLDAPVPRIAVENPVMHRHARELVGRGPDFTVQPWQFGHGETKRTCFWTRNLPALQPTGIVSGREGRVWKLPPGADRWKLRSVTYQGIADAMASQWG